MKIKVFHDFQSKCYSHLCFLSDLCKMTSPVMELKAMLIPQEQEVSQRSRHFFFQTEELLNMQLNR